MIEIVDSTMHVLMHKIGKHEKIDIDNIPISLTGACFHGEVWVRCPACKMAHQIVGKTPIRIKDGWNIYQCECGSLFKDK